MSVLIEVAVANKSLFCASNYELIRILINALISNFRDKFLSGKKCQFHCSWKLVALALTLLTLVLSSVIAYFGGEDSKADCFRFTILNLLSVSSVLTHKCIGMNLVT